MPLDDHRPSSYTDEDIFDPPKTNGDQATSLPTDQESFNAPFRLYWPAQPNPAPPPADPDGHHAWRWRQYQDHQAEVRKMIISGLPYLSEARLGLILDGLYGADEASSPTAQRIADIHERLIKPRVELPTMSIDSPAFYGLAGDIAKRYMGYTEADPAAILVQYMTIMGNIMNRAYLEYRQEDVVTCRTNILLVGRSGQSRKGTSLKCAEFIVKQAAEEWYEHCVWRGASTGEGLLNLLRDPPDDGLGAQRDSRLMLLLTEFAIPLAKMRDKNSILSPIIRQAFDGTSIDLPTRVDPIHASGIHMNIVGHITPHELIEQMPMVELRNGFINRVPPFHVTSTPSNGLLPNMSEAEYIPLVQETVKVIEHSRNVCRYELTKPGQQKWSEIYMRLLADKPDGIMEDLVQRGSDYVLRWALTYALLDRSDGIVNDVHLNAAYHMWVHCRRTFEALWGGVILNDDAQRLFDVLKQAGPIGLSHTDINKAFHNNTDRSRRARVDLLDKGYAYETISDTARSGRPTTFVTLTEFYV